MIHRAVPRNVFLGSIRPTFCRQKWARFPSLKNICSHEKIFRINVRNQRAFRCAAAPNSSSYVPKIQKGKTFADRNGKFGDLLTEQWSGGVTHLYLTAGTGLLIQCKPHFYCKKSVENFCYEKNG